MSEFRRTPKQTEAMRLFGSNAKHVLLFGGSRSGKTFITVLAIIARALKAPRSRHCIIRRHFVDVRQSVGMDTLPKVMQLRWPKVRYELNKTDWYMTLPNGAEIWLAGLDEKERADKILGKEFCTLYFNEASQLSYDSIQVALTRLAQNCPAITNKVFYDCNPTGKSHWSYKLFVLHKDPTAENRPLPNPEDYAAMLINPADNSDNLPPGYINTILGGLAERERQRFLEGKWLDDIEGALWKRSIISSYRVNVPPDLIRVVVAIDPAVTNTEQSDRTGIVVAGIAGDGHCYVLGDHTCKASPLEWAKKAVELYHLHRADRVIGEVNNGGDLIESTLRRVDPSISFRAVRATRGKILRAEPVAALYEQGKVHHCGYFSELEDEMCSYTGADGQSSPDRLDALVWALTELTGISTASRSILA